MSASLNHFVMCLVDGAVAIAGTFALISVCIVRSVLRACICTHICLRVCMRGACMCVYVCVCVSECACACVCGCGCARAHVCACLFLSGKAWCKVMPFACRRSQTTRPSPAYPLRPQTQSQQSLAPRVAAWWAAHARGTMILSQTILTRHAYPVNLMSSACSPIVCQHPMHMPGNSYSSPTVCQHPMHMPGTCYSFSAASVLAIPCLPGERRVLVLMLSSWGGA